MLYFTDIYKLCIERLRQWENHIGLSEEIKLRANELHQALAFRKFRHAKYSADLRKQAQELQKDYLLDRVVLDDPSRNELIQFLSETIDALQMNEYFIELKGLLLGILSTIFNQPISEQVPDFLSAYNFDSPSRDDYLHLAQHQAVNDLINKQVFLLNEDIDEYRIKQLHQQTVTHEDYQRYRLERYLAAHNEKDTVFNLRHQRVDDNALRLVIATLQRMTKLKMVDFLYTDFTTRGINIIVDEIQKLNHVDVRF